MGGINLSKVFYQAQFNTGESEKLFSMNYFIFWPE